MGSNSDMWVIYFNKTKFKKKCKCLEIMSCHFWTVINGQVNCLK
jgi:hypothetical protein